jgi:arylsulfatase A-like enzyme
MPSSRPRRSGRRAVTSTLVLALCALALAGGPGRAVSRDASGVRPWGDERPNVVVILTDDQRRESIRYMPQVQRLLVEQGTKYTRAMVPTALCCPSRATILTGKYAHTTRVYGNGDVGGARLGGWRRFHRTGAEKRTMAVALRKAGYRTAMIGKYLNFFGRHSEPGYVPPGWDEFSTFMSPHGRYYSYRLYDGTHHGESPEDYSTDVFAAKATDFIHATPAEQPLFLFFAPYAPHSPYLPAPRHDGSMKGLLPDYTAPTITQPLRTMPRWMRHRVHVTKTEVDWMRLNQQESLLAVDEAVGGIHQALQETGRDRDTLYLFLSDNGYFWGEHRSIGKDAPYKDSTYIPMVARWDGHLAAGAVDKSIVLNVDVARTVTKATGAPMRTDGIDIFGTKERKGFLLEAMKGYHDRPPYCGWRTKHRMFVQWGTGEMELFDYRRDRAERHNLAYKRSWRDVRDRMRAKAVKACVPEPPGFDW